MAYQISFDQVESFLLSENNKWERTLHVPMKILHETSHQRYSFQEHSRKYELYRQNEKSPISLTLFLPGKKFSFFVEPVIKFLKKYEKVL